MDPFGNLSFENGQQIRKYLRFFAQKKEGIIRTINNEFTDAKADKLNEDMYTREDVDDFCEFLSTAVRNNVTHEVATVINMSALAVSQLLESAQDKGVELELETSALENETLLKEVDKMTLDALPTKSKVPQRLGTLKSFKDDAKALKDESGRVDEVNKRLTQQVQELQSQISVLNRQLREERNATAEGKQSDRHNASDLADRVRKYERALEEQREENNKRVSETKQFQEMRKLMQSQSKKITDLKRRLERYEPDNTKEDDDG